MCYRIFIVFNFFIFSFSFVSFVFSLLLCFWSCFFFKLLLVYFLYDGVVDLCLDFIFVVFVEEFKLLDVDVEVDDDIDKYLGYGVFFKSVELSDLVSDCEEIFGVNFCGL